MDGPCQLSHGARLDGAPLCENMLDWDSDQIIPCSASDQLISSSTKLICVWNQRPFVFAGRGSAEWGCVDFEVGRGRGRMDQRGHILKAMCLVNPPDLIFCRAESHIAADSDICVWHRNYSPSATLIRIIVF